MTFGHQYVNNASQSKSKRHKVSKTIVPKLVTTCANKMNGFVYAQ